MWKYTATPMRAYKMYSWYFETQDRENEYAA
jgi:hypothetical protein